MRAEFFEINEKLTEFLHSESSMLILRIDDQQLITYCNNGFLELFCLSKKPIGAGLIDFLLPGSNGVLFETGIQEFVCNPRTGQHCILEVHKFRQNRVLSLWCEHPQNNHKKIVERRGSPANRFGGIHLIV